MLKNTSVLTILFVVLSSCFFSCKQSAQSDLLLGTWEGAIHVGAEDMQKMMEQEGPTQAGLSMEMDIDGSEKYLSDGTYDHNAEALLTTTVKGNEVVMQIGVRDAGTWEIKEGKLITVSSKAKVVPLNETAKNIFEQDPTSLDDFRPIKGAPVSREIVRMTKTAMTIKEATLNGMEMTYHKIEN